MLIDIGAHGYKAGEDGGDCERWPTVGDALEELRAAEIRDLAGPDGQDRDQEVESAAGVGTVFHFFPSSFAMRALSASFSALSSFTALTSAAISGRSDRVRSSAFSRFFVFFPFSSSTSVIRN